MPTLLQQELLKSFIFWADKSEPEESRSRLSLWICESLFLLFSTCLHPRSRPRQLLSALFCNFPSEVESVTCYSSPRRTSWTEAILPQGAGGLTLLLHYISSSGCAAAFCPRLVCWQEVAVGGWYLPHTVTCSQSKRGQADFVRFTERKTMWEKWFLHWKMAASVAAISSSLLLEKSQQVSCTLSDGQTAAICGQTNHRGRTDRTTATPF